MSDWHLPPPPLASLHASFQCAKTHDVWVLAQHFDGHATLADALQPSPSTGSAAIPSRMRSREQPPSSHTSRASSPEGRPIRRVRSNVSADGTLHVGSVSSTLTGSYIASLKNRDFASGNFRRV